VNPPTAGEQAREEKALFLTELTEGAEKPYLLIAGEGPAINKLLGAVALFKAEERLSPCCLRPRATKGSGREKKGYLSQSPQRAQRKDDFAFSKRLKKAKGSVALRPLMLKAVMFMKNRPLTDFS